MQTLTRRGVGDAAAGLGLHFLHMSEGPFSHDAGHMFKKMFNFRKARMYLLYENKKKHATCTRLRLNFESLNQTKHAVSLTKRRAIIPITKDLFEIK